MKGFRAIKRYFRDSIHGVFRNFSLSLASISCITITLIVVGVSLIMSANVENSSDSIRKDVTVVMFLKSTTTSEDVDKIKKELESIENIENKSIEFKSKVDSANELKKGNDIFSNTVDGWTPETNPLLDSYMFKVKDIEAVVALILVTAFLIANTIKLAIYSRKREIEIMRLVGASNVSIKIPFIFEGLFIGILGSIIPILIAIFGYTSLYDFFGGKLFGSALASLIVPMPFVYYISGILLLIGIVVGMIGSYQAVRKYLKI